MRRLPPLLLAAAALAAPAAAAASTGPITPYPVPPPPCLLLQIEPVQPFAPYTASPPLAQDPRGYADPSGTLRLETGMRLAAAYGSCAGSTSTGQAIRYGMTISGVQGATLTPIASDLAAEQDVPLPVFDPTQPVTIQFSVHKSTCSWIGTWICGTPTQISSGAYQAFVEPRGSYAAAGYSRTSFTVDNGVAPAGAFQTTHVTGVTLDASVPGPVSFSASGWSVANGASSRPAVNAIGVGQDFAIYADDFSDPHDPRPNAAALAKTGVSPAAGLEWPHVTGTRNGAPFQYAVDLPTLGRDELEQCYALFGPAVGTWYRLPFRANEGWKLFNGNYDDPKGGHANAVGSSGGNQAYAFDFAPDTNNNGIGEPQHDVLAARSGIVVDEQTGETGNSWNLDQDGDGIPDGVKLEDANGNQQILPVSGYTGVGNFVVLLHEDGTYGVYWHFMPNSITVNVGDHVHRGDVLGEDGWTGNASMPHLHFDVRGNWNVAYPETFVEYPTIPVRFEDSGHPAGCWLPRDLEPLASNNG